MKKLFVTAAVAAAFVAPAAAQAQAVPAAVVAVVDLERVSTNCNACKTAQTALQGQITALQNREKTLSAPLETEGKAIQAAVAALKGKDPDAALQARMKAWQAKRDQGAQEIATQQQQIQRNQQYIQQQIAQKLGPIYQQVMQRRGANILVEMGATLASSQSVDVSNDVVAALNAALPSIATQAPPAATQKSQPEGR
jgi:Skp family chaperone for outer membrane proteins